MRERPAELSRRCGDRGAGDAAPCPSARLGQFRPKSTECCPVPAWHGPCLADIGRVDLAPKSLGGGIVEKPDSADCGRDRPRPNSIDLGRRIHGQEKLSNAASFQRSGGAVLGKRFAQVSASFDHVCRGLKTKQRVASAHHEALTRRPERRGPNSSSEAAPAQGSKSSAARSPWPARSLRSASFEGAPRDFDVRHELKPRQVHDLIMVGGRRRSKHIAFRRRVEGISFELFYLETDFRRLVAARATSSSINFKWAQAQGHVIRRKCKSKDNRPQCVSSMLEQEGRILRDGLPPVIYMSRFALMRLARMQLITSSMTGMTVCVTHRQAENKFERHLTHILGMLSTKAWQRLASTWLNHAWSMSCHGRPKRKVSSQGPSISHSGPARVALNMTFSVSERHGCVRASLGVFMISG